MIPVSRGSETSKAHSSKLRELYGNQGALLRVCPERIPCCKTRVPTAGNNDNLRSECNFQTINESIHPSISVKG